MRKLLAAACLLLMVSAGSASAQPQPKMFGVFVSNRIDLAASAGFTTVEKDVWVTPSYRKFSDLPLMDRTNLLAYLAYARANHIGVILNEWQVNWVKGSDPPNRPNQWRGMCNVLTDIVNQDITNARLEGTNPAIQALAIGVEPNSKHFWESQDTAARNYFAWAAACYDWIKPTHTDLPIYAGSLASQAGPGGTGPGDFIAQMCQAYHDSDRNRPFMDGWDQHSYEDVQPTTQHPNSDTITIGDGSKLEQLLGCFGQGVVPILWGEIGYQSQIPPGMVGLYQDSETANVVDEVTQGQWYAKAIQMAFCQPYTAGIFIFHMDDDPSLADWQSGLYYTNPARQLSGTGGYTDVAKQSLPIVQQALAAIQNGQMQCR